MPICHKFRRKTSQRHVSSSMTPSPRFQRRKFKDSVYKTWPSLRILVGILIFVLLSTSLLVNYTFLRQNHTFLLPNNTESSTSLRKRHSRHRLEFVHITKTAGSAIEKAAAEHGILWGACHYMKLPELGCLTPDIIDYIAPNYQSYALTSPWHTPPKILQRRVDRNFYPYQDADMFTVVRNPYDRFVSEYYCPWAGYKGANKDHPNTMNEWITHVVVTMEQLLRDFHSKQQLDKQPQVQGPNLNEDPYLLAQKHFINQAEYVYDEQNQIVQHVLHYENLALEFASLMQLYNLSVRLTAKSDSDVQGKSGTNFNTTHFSNFTKRDTSIIYKKDGKLTSQDLFPETIALINRYAAKDFVLLGYDMR